MNKKRNLIIKRYKKGEISIGKAAKLLGLTISETMDLFVKLKIKSNLTVEDYLEGYKNIKSWNIFKKK